MDTDLYNIQQEIIKLKLEDLKILRNSINNLIYKKNSDKIKNKNTSKYKLIKEPNCNCNIYILNNNDSKNDIIYNVKYYFNLCKKLKEETGISIDEAIRQVAAKCKNVNVSDIDHKSNRHNYIKIVERSVELSYIFLYYKLNNQEINTIYFRFNAMSRIPRKKWNEWKCCLNDIIENEIKNVI